MTDEMALARHGLPHKGHPSEKYSLNWEMEQAGSGWLSIGNYYGFSLALIKKVQIAKPQGEFQMLQRAAHENIVGLIEAFYDDQNLYLAYNYHGFAVHLSQVLTTPTITLNEPELASICKNILKGLEYIHEELRIFYGTVDCQNVILCPDGVIKLANVGSAMVAYGLSQDSMQSDCESVGALLAHCLTPTKRSSGSQCFEPCMSIYAAHFIKNVGSTPYSCLYEHAFFQQASPDDRTWYLIPHYLETMMYWRGFA